MCGIAPVTSTTVTSTVESVTSETIAAETSKNQSANDTTAGETTEGTTTESADASGEAPTIKLEIYEGPTYSAADDICYYRIKAIVTGNPAPTITFSKDDSNGSFGKDKVQINLTKSSPSYTLTAKAKNSAGEGTASLALTWGCNSNPVINDITLSSATVLINSIYDVTASAADPDGDSLTYEWTVSGGTINNNAANPMKWTTPNAAGDYTIQVKITDGNGGEATKSKTVNVGLPAALNMNVPKITAEGGWLEKNGLLHQLGESFYVGDSNLNKACRSFISFNIEDLAGATINSATITGSIKKKWGDPSVLGPMWIGVVNWGELPIVLSDFDLAGTAVQSFPTAGDGNFTCNADALKTQLQSAITAGKTRFQIRIHMAAESSNNNDWDGFEYSQSGVILTVTYTH
jgi:hypothetical protein